VHRHADVGLSVDVESLPSGRAGQCHIDQFGWKGVLGVANLLAEEEVLGSKMKHGEPALFGAHVADQFEGLTATTANLRSDELGVVEGLTFDHLVTTLEDVGACRQVTGRGQGDGGQEAGRHEEQGDPLAQADGTESFAQGHSPILPHGRPIRTANRPARAGPASRARSGFDRAGR